MVGPLVSEEFGADEYVVDINFEGADPWIYNWLVGFFIDEQIFIVLDFWGFDELIRYWVLDDNGIGYKLLDFPFD